MLIQRHFKKFAFGPSLIFMQILHDKIHDKQLGLINYFAQDVFFDDTCERTPPPLTQKQGLRTIMDQLAALCGYEAALLRAFGEFKRIDTQVSYQTFLLVSQKFGDRLKSLDAKDKKVQLAQ